MKYFLFFLTAFFSHLPLCAEETNTHTSYLHDVVHMLITLMLLLFVVAGTLYLLKKLMRSRLRYLNRSTAIKILEKRALSQKSSLYLIDILGKGVVVSESQGHIQLICEFPKEVDITTLMEETQSCEPAKPSFKEMMQDKIGKYLSPKS